MQEVLKNTKELVAEVFLDGKFSVPLGFRGRQSETENEPSKSPIEWNIRHINAEKGWKEFGTSGFGMLFASADTGVDFMHPALRGNYAGVQPNGEVDHNYSWWDGVKDALADGKGPCGINSPVPCDDNGHGTHTTSTAVGREGLGVAPGAKWIACPTWTEVLVQAAPISVAWSSSWPPPTWTETIQEQTRGRTSLETRTDVPMLRAAPHMRSVLPSRC